ncbi:MAG: (Fe-S)-binding protein [Firmicutes bacterium]|nr:(Fe-S)-binding protein [Bacillota bacterium]
MAAVNGERLLDCAICPNMCRCECPVDQEWRREASSPAGKARLAHLLLEGRLEWDSALLEVLSTCLGCRGCQLLCPFPGLDLSRELLRVRTEVCPAGITLPAAVPYLNNLKKFGSPYGARRSGSASRERQGRPEVLYFVNCTAQANNPRMQQLTLELLGAAGVSYEVLDQYCCGYPAQIWGDLDLARQLAEENAARIAGSGASLLLTDCPECWHTFTECYPCWGSELELPVIDTATYFLELVRQKRLKPGPVKEIGRITYHDPCIWARVADKCEAPRELLQSIPALELEEARPGGQETRCCGGGAMFQLTFPERSARIARRRLSELPPSDALVTSCPFCRENLQADGAEVLDLVELLSRAVFQEKDE